MDVLLEKIFLAMLKADLGARRPSDGDIAGHCPLLQVLRCLILGRPKSERPPFSFWLNFGLFYIFYGYVVLAVDCDHGIGKI